MEMLCLINDMDEYSKILDDDSEFCHAREIRHARKNFLQPKVKADLKKLDFPAIFQI